MSDLQGYRQAVERLDQIAADLAVSHSGLQERSSEIRKLATDIRGDLAALHNAYQAKEGLLQTEYEASKAKAVAAKTQEVGATLQGVVKSEVRDGLQSLRKWIGGLAAVVVLFFGWSYFRNPAASELKRLVEETQRQERLAALTRYLQADGKGGWIVEIQKGSVFRGANGQSYARLPGK